MLGKGLARDRGLHRDMSHYPPRWAAIPRIPWHCQCQAEHTSAGLVPPAWAEEEDGKAAWVQGTTQVEGIRMLCHGEALLSLRVRSETSSERELGRCPILAGA